MSGYKSKMQNANKNISCQSHKIYSMMYTPLGDLKDMMFILLCHFILEIIINNINK